MTTTITTPDARSSTVSCDPTRSVTKTLLGYGVIAGPVYVGVVAAQASTRDGFDVSRHAASLLSNGNLGWIQVTTFLVTGLMVMAGAVGMRRAVPSGRERTWGPRLIGLYGAGLFAAGLFRADPMDGFPVGTPEGTAAVSWHGGLHMVAAGVGFYSLIAACLLFGRRFADLGQRRWAAYSVATGVIFFAAFGALASGAIYPATVITFWVAVGLAWIWVSALALHLYRHVDEAV